MYSILVKIEYYYKDQNTQKYENGVIVGGYDVIGAFGTLVGKILK